MQRARGVLWTGALVGVIALLAAACGPTAEPTATTAPARPTATTAPGVPTATTAPAPPTATTAPGVPTATTAPAEVKLRPVPVLALPAPNPNAQYGGVFRQLETETPATFHAWEQCCGAASAIWGNTLTQFNIYAPGRGEAGEVVPALAYDWWTDESGEEWTFKLREGVTFHDGEAFTCADVKFMMDTARLGRDARGSELLSSPKGPLLQRVTETRCVDDYTLELETDGPLPSLIPSLALPNFGVYPQHWLEGNQPRARDEEPPGTGPFVFGDYSPTEKVSYTRNPNYWHNPYPYLDEVQQLAVGSRTAIHTAYRVGRGDYMKGHQEFPVAQREEMIAAGRLVKDPMVASQGVSYLHTNWLRQPVGDPRVALAVRCALDSGAIVDTVYDGEGFEGPMFPLASDPGGSPWALTEEEWMAIGPCHGKTAKTNMAQRRQIARDLLAEMGFGPGNPLVLDVPVRSGSSDWEVEETQLRAVGFDFVINIGTYASQIQKAYNGEFDLYDHGFGSSRVDPDHWLYEHFYSTSDRNYGKYTNAEVDALIDLQSRTLDQETRYGLLKQIETKLVEDNAKILIRHRAYVHHYPPWINGFGVYTYNGSFYTPVWVDQAVKDRLGG